MTLRPLTKKSVAEVKDSVLSYSFKFGVGFTVGTALTVLFVLPVLGCVAWIVFLIAGTTIMSLFGG